MTTDEAFVWGVYRAYHLRCGPTPPAAARKLLTAALKQYPADDVAVVVAWVHESPEERAKYLRDHGFTGLDNVLRVEKLMARVEMARKWRPTNLPPPVAPEEAPVEESPRVVAALDFLAEMARGGTAAEPPRWKHHPDRQRALWVATEVVNMGGWANYYADPVGFRARFAERLRRSAA